MNTDDKERRQQERWQLEQERRDERETAAGKAAEQERQSRVEDAGKATADELQDAAKEVAEVFEKLGQFARDHQLPPLPSAKDHNLLPSPSADLSGLSAQVVVTSDHTYVSAPVQGELDGAALLLALGFTKLMESIASTAMEWYGLLLELERSEPGQPERATSEREGTGELETGGREATPQGPETHEQPDVAGAKRLTEELAALDKEHSAARAQRESELRDTMKQVLAKNPDWIGDADRMDQLQGVVEAQLQKMDELHEEMRREVQAQTLMDEHERYNDR
jgi:hypothetical protein